jgi:CIC family chloride channel protein
MMIFNDGGMLSRFAQRLYARLRVTSPLHVYMYAIFIGLVTGLFGLAFNHMLHAVRDAVFLHGIGLALPYPRGEGVAGSPSVPFSPFLLFLAPAAGGILSGIVTTYFCHDARGGGTDAIIRAFHSEGGRIGGRVPFFKSLATIFTVGFGGSAGKEGPIMQIGAGIGSLFGRVLRVGDRAHRSMMLAGVAAGLATVFRAPFGGALTAVEVVYREDIESDSLLPAILSAVSAYMIVRAFQADAAIFVVPPVQLNTFYELLFYVLLGLVCVGTGYLFTAYFRFVRRIFENWKVHPVLKPAVGGLIVGLAAVLFHDSIGDGSGVLQEVILGRRPDAEWWGLTLFFLFLAGLKIITTSFTVATGGSGGVFTPSLFIGGMLGGAVGVVAQHTFPDLNIPLVSFIMVGMGGFFIGVAHAPIAGMVMVCDMVGNYTLLPALMIVSVLSTVLSRFSIYEGQVENRFHSPAHYWDMNLNLLSQMKIENFSNLLRHIATVEPSRLVHRIEQDALALKATDFIVVGKGGTYEGICSLRHFRHTPETEALRNLLTAADVAREIPAMKLTDTFSDALQVMMENEIDKVAVVGERNEFLGYLRFVDIMQAYNQRVR